ncbi:MAG: hypothetical protein JWP08_1494 [Bryobacterales bacterium]|nr:hypothetical protein [Bryobacterales bacterium]
MLQLLAACERYGLSPIPKSGLHEVAYLANSLSRVYNLTPPLPTLIRRDQGPSYPDFQWDLDRLCCQGLAEAKSIQWRTSEDGIQFSADYTLSRAGLAFVSSFREIRSSQFVSEVVSAYADVKRERGIPLSAVDLTFSDPSMAPYSLVDLSGATETLRLVDRFRDASSILTPSGRDSVHLYMRYLDKVRSSSAVSLL